MTEVTYNQFRGLHKGIPQKEISDLWKKYKDGGYKLPSTEEPVVEEPVVEEPVVEEPVVEEPVVEAPKSKKKKELSPLEKCNEYERYRRELLRFSFKYNEEETQKVLDRMSQLARETLPDGYTCEPTDSWKIWFGPTRECLLINTTRQMAFKVDRDWWKTHYQTTIYVDRELLNDPSHIETEKMRYARRKQYIPRTPVVGLECKLPRSYKDIKIRGGQAGDR
jgi:hypothetical protein